MALFDGVEGCALVGMVHLLPLPGSAGWDGNTRQLRERARRDANMLADGGCDALLVENMGDVPYLKGRISDAGVALMTLVVEEVVSLGLPVGVQILAAANEQAMAVAGVTGASFIRAEGFAFGHLADEGWIDACAGPLLRQRARDGHHQVKVWADVRKKHSAHAATADMSITELARGHRFCGADALVLTGSETGQPTAYEDLVAASDAGLPLAVGSGVTPDDAHRLSGMADAVIVGSWLKEDGDWRAPVSLSRVKELAVALRTGT